MMRISPPFVAIPRTNGSPAARLPRHPCSFAVRASPSAAMNTDRLQQLRALLAEEPGDHFLRYAIALEHKRLGGTDQAIADLEALLHDAPQHIASYYQLALLLAGTGRSADALHVCEAGLLQCIVAGDRKARAELQELRNTIAEDA